MRRLPPACSLVFPAALLLIWPALVLGRPSIFYDSDGYRAAGVSVLSLLHGIGARLLGRDGPVLESWSMFAAGSAESLSFMGARSPYYGFLLALAEAAGSLWIALYVQALAVAWLVWTWLRAAAPGAGARAYLCLVAGLAAATSLPFFAGFLMPDLFTSVALLGAVLLLVYPEQLGRRTQIAVWLLLAASLTFHTSNLLALAAVLILVFAVLVARTGVRPAARRSAATGAAVLAAVLAALAYPMAVRALPGPQELHSPPFLTARVLADGPGRSYLAAACGQGRAYALCAFRAADLSDADSFLWEETVGTGVYQVASLPVREQLRAEQARFVAGVFTNAPLRQLGASLGNWGRQLAAFHVEEPITAQGKVFAQSVTRVPGAQACLQARTCDSAFSVGLLQVVHGLLLAAALGFLGWRLTRGDVRAAFGPHTGGARQTALQSVAAAGLILGFLLVNAAVCGMLSGPAPRYEARVVWMVPALAGVLACALPRPAVQTAAPRAAWGDLRAVAASLSRFDRPLLRFAAVGGSGFVLDAGLTHGLVHFAALSPIPARLCAFSIAVCFTWLLNRHWTFAARRSPRPLKEAFAYALVQGLGAAANLSVYAGALNLMPRLEAWLIVPLVLGAATGMSVTYLGSKHVVFARRAVG